MREHFLDIAFSTLECSFYKVEEFERAHSAFFEENLKFRLLSRPVV